MKGISHQQAVKLIDLRLDGLVNESQSRSLDEHLESCDSCRAYAVEINALPIQLQKEFHMRWDQNLGPSHNVMRQVVAKGRKIPMTNRLLSGVRMLTSVAVLVLFVLGINFVISQMQSNSIDAIETQSVSGSELSDNRLIAFTSEKDGNAEIYTMRADGSNLTNITNNDALDFNPAWSPDGKRIAFESNRAVFTQIYLMDSDGSNVTQLTFDEIEHEMTMNYAHSNPWSPDGNHLLFFQRSYGGKESAPELAELYSIDTNGGNKIMLASGSISLFNVSWSPDGKHVAYIADDPQNPNASRLYIVNADGSDRRDITKSLQANERLDGFSYDWSVDSQSILFIAYKHISEGNDQWIAYETSLDGETLIRKAASSTPMDSWWDGTTFITGFDQSILTWLRSDGTYSILQPLENCQFEKEPKYSFLARRASNGNLIISVGCPNGDLWFYWANPDGTFIKQLFDAPLSIKDGGLNDIVWSPDNKYIAINVYSADVTDIYVINIEESLRDPSALPDPIGSGAIGHSISWQPVP
ncbi:MAG TPA: zf-HC2 domain-containing protein [Anaerolineales bacterium]|nr:zf-HC2 domain-containing protein [Anaerolineales bacterium]